MATDPFRVRRRYDLQSLSEAVQQIMQALNLGAAAINQNTPNVPAMYLLYPFRSYATVLASLPSPSDAGVGARAMITDSLISHADGVGTHAVSGGVSVVPVYSDGTSWRIG